MNELLDTENKILIVHPSSLFRYLPSPRLFKELRIKLEVGQKINIDELINKLVKSGYYRVNKIDRSLEFARRGDIIDIFSINHEFPIRISLFDDEIESINYFDISTQTRKNKLSEITIIPSSDMLFNETESKFIERKLHIQYEEDKVTLKQPEADSLKSKVEEIISRFTNFEYSDSLYKYYGFLQDKHYSILDYFDANYLIYSNKEQFDVSYDLLKNESRNFLDSLKDDGEVISHLEMFQDKIRTLSNRKILLTKKFKQGDDEILFNVRNIVTSGNKNDYILSTINSYLLTNDKVIIALANPSQKEIIIKILSDNNLSYEDTNGLDIPNKSIGVSLYSLSEGFELPNEKIAVLSAKELFFYSSNNRISSRFQEGIILHSFEELKPGDYVVHEYNGIGQFIDIKTLEDDGCKTDYIHIKYSKGQELYVPLNQCRLIRKYSGREGYAPKLSTLGTSTWNKTKEKIKERLNELTRRLTSLYKERANIEGYAFPKDDIYQEKFNNEFIYQLTDDQEQAYRDIRDDMERPYPMDRLLCGDVGFGKTEVAFRAIFKCINSGKQAALLCPTTLLCRQHYELAKIRFASFGIRIAVFSRLVPLKEQHKYIEEIKKGNVHLIIGTHRLLSKEIKFNNLGLLVVDEEQRFGVEQKEKIKEIKKDVDVLSLSATPIPRTLQMSLVGVRSLSLINTPPQKRSSIQTYVTPYSEPIIKELIERELSRNGQVFYVHNSISTIYEKSFKLSQLVPLANIGVVHGKMERDDIENVMLKFYSGEINLLIATSIIENGIDVPNANMIIVENADTFGLAQLYQIKGRVGRSDRIAYAYLLYRQNKNMNEDATKRLKAIQEFAELGSGYKIAQRDLMIRGAGDLLGREQAGFIDSVGVDMYVKLLNEAVSKQKDIVIKDTVPNTPLNINAYIPTGYISKEDIVQIYQEIDNAVTLKDVDKIKRKIRDIYGRIPKEVNTLLIKRKIDILLEKREFKSMKDFPDRVIIILSNEFGSINGIGVQLFDVMYRYIDIVKITYIKKEFRLDISKEGLWLNNLKDILKEVHKLYLINIKDYNNNEEDS